MTVPASRVCLDYLTALEASPAEFVSLARRHGVDSVGLMVVPVPGLYPHDLANDAAGLRAVRDRCRAEGVVVDMVEPLILRDGVDPESFRSALVAGAELGAASVNVMALLRDRTAAAELLDQVAALAMEHGLAPVLEFSRRGTLTTLPEVVEIAKRIGRGLKAHVDTLHFCRLGGTAAQMEANAEWIGRIQICDGPAHMPDDRQMDEALHRRLPPGEGALPLAALLAAAPREITIAIEVPHPDIAMEDRITRSLRGLAAMLP